MLREETMGRQKKRWSYVATNKGILGTTRSWKVRKDPSLEPSEGVWPHRHLYFRLPTFRTVRK